MLSLPSTVCLFAFSVYSSFLFSLPLLRAFFPFSPALHLCFFCLLLSFFSSQSLSILSLPCPPSLRLTSLFVSLSQSSISFPFLLWVPLYSYLPLMSFHFSVFASAPAPPFRASPDRSLAQVANLPNSALFKETASSMSSNFSPTSSCDICGS